VVLWPVLRRWLEKSLEETNLEELLPFTFEIPLGTSDIFQTQNLDWL
jgi:hypothetical protein